MFGSTRGNEMGVACRRGTWVDGESVPTLLAGMMWTGLMSGVHVAVLKSLLQSFSCVALQHLNK